MAGTVGTAGGAAAGTRRAGSRNFLFLLKRITHRAEINELNWLPLRLAC
jgi:hypothetical protein